MQRAMLTIAWGVPHSGATIKTVFVPLPSGGPVDSAPLQTTRIVSNDNGAFDVGRVTTTGVGSRTLDRARRRQEEVIRA
jgi:hypothetical protein